MLSLYVLLCSVIVYYIAYRVKPYFVNCISSEQFREMLQLGNDGDNSR